MSISLSAFSSVVIDFVGEVFIPVLDKNNLNFTSCIQKWQEFRQNVMKKVLNFKTEQELRQKVKIICKFQNQQKSQKQTEQKNQKQQQIDRFSQSKISQDEKSNKSRTQAYTNKNIEWQRQEIISFRDRKTSIDENPARKQQRQKSQIMIRKQERSNSFNTNGLDNDIVEVPLIYAQGHQVIQKSKNAYQKKENELLSFNSISEFHKSRNNIPLTATKQVKDNNENHLPQQQVHIMSKKSIEEAFIPSSISQAKPNSYSTNYIQSVKKINIESRSPNSKPKPSYFSDLDTSHDYVETTPLRGQESQHLRISAMESIKKRISDGTDYLTSPQIGSTDSFPKFLSSFKKLCTTFQSNHQKLLRQDFNNKYINC